MPKRKTTAVFNQAELQHAREDLVQSAGWGGLLELVDAEEDAILLEIPLDLIVREAAFFRVALKLRNDEIAREKKLGKESSMESVNKRKQTSQEYFDKAVEKLKMANKKVNQKTVGQELMKMNIEHMDGFSNPFDPSIKQIYRTGKTKLNKVFITDGFIKTACQRYKKSLETSKLAREILETY
jgi:hypothetical protein